jgi:hypothetical protein
MLVKKYPRTAATWLGLVITLLVLFIYLPILAVAVQPSEINEGLNYSEIRCSSAEWHCFWQRQSKGPIPRGHLRHLPWLRVDSPHALFRASAALVCRL